MVGVVKRSGLSLRALCLLGGPMPDPEVLLDVER